MIEYIMFVNEGLFLKIRFTCIYVKLKSYHWKIKLLLFPLVLQIWFLECITDKKKRNSRTLYVVSKLLKRRFISK